MVGLEASSCSSNRCLFFFFPFFFFLPLFFLFDVGLFIYLFLFFAVLEKLWFGQTNILYLHRVVVWWALLIMAIQGGISVYRIEIEIEQLFPSWDSNLRLGVWALCGSDRRESAQRGLTGLGESADLTDSECLLRRCGTVGFPLFRSSLSLSLDPSNQHLFIIRI